MKLQTTMSSEIISLHKAQIFQRNHLVLKDVSLQINKGEFVYLIGKTGSGKSTLMKTLYGNLPLEKGEGRIVGYDLHKLKVSKIPFLRRKLGIVFQDFNLLNDRTVYDNLLFSLRATGWKGKKKINDKIKEVLDKVGMKGKEHKMPYSLSGGEQQRIGIARALLNDPDLILADEPTGNLDPATSTEIMNVLIDIYKSGKTILMSTHDYPLLLKFPFRTIKCEDERVFEVNYK